MGMPRLLKAVNTCLEGGLLSGDKRLGLKKGIDGSRTRRRGTTKLWLFAQGGNKIVRSEYDTRW